MMEKMSKFWKRISKSTFPITADMKAKIFDAKYGGHQFFEFIKNRGYKCKRAFLGINPHNSFDLLYAIELSDYLKPEFKFMYSESYKYRLVENTDDFHLSIIFMPYSDAINLDTIIADGYVFEHK